jgi:lysozyme
MLDLEAPFKPDATAKNFGIAFCKRLAAAGVRPAVYMSASFAAVLRPDRWDVPGLVIVIARYGARPEAPGSGQYLGRYDVHQYSSSGTLPGSAGLVDFDESYTNAHLLTEAEEMAFTSDDFAHLMWGNVFDANGNRNFAQFLKDMDAKIGALAAKAGGAPAEEIAAKLLPALTTALVAEVAKRDAISDADAEQIAEAVTAHAGALLTGGASQ